MLKVILALIISSFIGSVIYIATSEKFAGLKKAEYTTFIIKQDAIGCKSKELYARVVEFYKNNNKQQIEQLLNSKQCVFFKKNHQFSALNNICQDDNPNQIEEFSTLNFLFNKIYLPCFLFSKIP